MVLHGVKRERCLKHSAWGVAQRKGSGWGGGADPDSQGTSTEEQALEHPRLGKLLVLSGNPRSLVFLECRTGKQEAVDEGGGRLPEASSGRTFYDHVHLS